MKRTVFTLVMAMLASAVAYAGKPLRSGEPLAAGGSEGLSPMSFGLTYSNIPRGSAFVSSQEHPDIFVLIKVGMPEVRGFWRCAYDTTTDEGEPVYKSPERVSTPWDDQKNPPTSIRIFQDGDNVWLVHLTTRKLEVARMEDYGDFVKFTETPLQGITHPVSSFDFIRRGKNEIEVALLCSDGKKYRPDIPEDESYYNAAEIYQGELPAAGIFRFSVDNDWRQVSRVEQVSRDMNAMIGPSELACVRSADGRYDGYLFTGMLGSMKFIPYCKRIPAAGLAPQYVMKDDRNIRVHRAYSSRIIAVPAAGRGCSDILIGGESAMYRYRFEGFAANGAPLYAEPETVLERNAPLYGGSLTVPNVVDWDGDGVLDIVAGNSEGRLLFFKNCGTNHEPDFARSEEVCAGGQPILLRPGYHVVQGPFEASWGYLCPTVFDWNNDGLPDVIVSGSRAKFEVLLNRGTRENPVLDAPVALSVDNLELFGTWRVRPAIAKIDGRNVIVIMDADNALHMYRQVDDFHVEDAGKILMTNGKQITGHNNNHERMGQWGRGKLCFVDWNGDGNLDLLVGSVKRSSYPSPERGLPYSRFKKKQTGMQVMYFENAGTDTDMRFKEPVQLQLDGNDFYLGAHSNAPEPCLLGDTSNGPNLVVGCESGKYFFFEHNRITMVGIDD